MTIALMPHFDTHQFIKTFLVSKNDEEKAETIAHEFTDVRSDVAVVIDRKFEEAKSELATKSDLASEKSDLKGEITELRSELRTEASKIRGEISSLETRLTNKFYLAVGGLAVFMTTLIVGILPMILR